MGFDATARRRWLGALALITALAMIVAAETVLKGRLSSPASLIYWLICLILTALAMLAALLDLRALRRQARDKQQDLFQQTLRSIETDAKTQPRGRASERASVRKLFRLGTVSFIEIQQPICLTDFRA